MRLTVLGSGGIHADPTRGGPAHLLEHDDQRLLLDCGPGCLRALAAQGVPTADLSAVAITHRHPDHLAELQLLLELEQTMGRRRPLGLIGPAILDELLDFYAAWGREEPRPLAYPIARVLVPSDAEGVASFEISGRAMPHVAHSVGYRIEADGRVLVYPGDCGPGPEVVDLAAGADVLVLECTLPGGVTYDAHLNPDQAADIASRARVGRLILTHFPPNVDPDEAVAICRRRGLRAEAAFDGLRIEF